MKSTERKPRSWAGVAIADRQRIRRSELLDAGVQLLGAAGGPAVNVRAVCRATGLTERYFYESFSDRDQFVLQVYETVAERARDALIRAVASTESADEVAAAAVTAFVELMVDDPAMGRVLLIAPRSEPSLVGYGAQAIPGFVDLIHARLTEISEPQERRMVAIGLVGALVTLFGAYLDGVLEVDRERLVRHCVDMLDRANRPD